MCEHGPSILGTKCANELLFQEVRIKKVKKGINR